MELVFTQRTPEFDERSGPSPTGLKETCQAFFWYECGIFVIDGHKGNDDGLVRFNVFYNDVYHFYRFVCLGGTKHKTIAQELVNWFKKKRYKVSRLETTWTWEDKIYVPGTQFEVAARKK